VTPLVLPVEFAVEVGTQELPLGTATQTPARSVHRDAPSQGTATPFRDARGIGCSRSRAAMSPARRHPREPRVHNIPE